MITETAYIAYFTSLAEKHNQIMHGVDGRAAFFYIPIEMDLTEIDNAIRANKSVPLMALDALHGSFDDNQSDRHLQTVAGQFTILDKAAVGKQESIRAVQDSCLKIGMQILQRMKVELRSGELMANGTRFTIHNVQYDPVGPMEVAHYGYTFRYTITCPFVLTVDNGNWLDK
ncbi:hypothetical protein GCM10023149_30750 [Mucilaginibacter gynuensis]|uniref:Uncharacterized protein n=1 Tax=Mucilaginibacter gynuensis TaxID=1302236 RepID=A0ABP8GNA5_9SPHI